MVVVVLELLGSFSGSACTVVLHGSVVFFPFKGFAGHCWPSVSGLHEAST